MAVEYSVEVCRTLQEKFRGARLHRPERLRRYDAGTELVYDCLGIEQANTQRVHLVIEKFVGGGFAGQVYKVKVLALEGANEPIEALEVGGVYAMKILIPPSSFARLFRNALYWVGFQAPFQLQVNPTAARAGVLWQKFIRRGAKIRFGDERAVVDIYATFVDTKLGSCGELSEWVDGRTWRLEVDDRLDLLKRWRRGRKVDAEGLGSPEYRAKREFMSEFVELLHDMGAYEVARQYEWSTCKSQPNCLKRRKWQVAYGKSQIANRKYYKRQAINDLRQAICNRRFAMEGLVAVDFRAGLALLPFLPMSPGDFKLIARGFMRGSLVQFDRGDINKLQQFVDSHSDEFANMGRMLEELKSAERVYRHSVLDITHNRIQLLYQRRLWSTILDSAVTGWKVRNLVDEEHEQKLRAERVLTLLFFAVGVIPFFGTFLQRIWGRADRRKHYATMMTSWDYFRRAVQARAAEKVILWHRAGRVDGERAIRIAETLRRFFCHLPLSILPAGLHRFLTDSQFRKDKLAYIFVRPFKLYFNAELREQWLREMITHGRKKHILGDEDACAILSQIKEPYIQKYLISLVVHLLTLPVTQVVSLTVATIYWVTHWGQPHAFAIGWGIIAVFQVFPISPGSLVRGFYVLYLVIRERNFKDYNIAVFLGFFKYIGYLAFPIQMTYHYPALARFMSAHWATEAVHHVAVFGETGALLEHWVFCLFYNWPLTIRRRMRKQARMRTSMEPRYWHVGLWAAAAAIIFGLVDFAYLSNMQMLPGLKDIWWLVVLMLLLCGAGVTLGCGGAVLWKRIIAATVCGVVAGVLYTAVSVMLGQAHGVAVGEIARGCVWRVFVFAALSTIGAIVAELKLPGPDLG